MSNCTLLIQGRLTESTLAFYAKNHHNLPVVVSTWTDNSISLKDLPSNFRVIISEKPKEPRRDSVNYQVTSTLNGLKYISTTFVIKVRGDEIISNLPYILDQMYLQEDKLYVLPVFFRPWTTSRYHISDHLIAGKYSHMLQMFETAKEWCEESNTDKYVPEQVLTIAYLSKKYGGTTFSLTPINNEVDGRISMIESFEILDLTKLSPYTIVANCFNKIYRDFIPEQNGSISRISMLLNSFEQTERIEKTAKTQRKPSIEDTGIPMDFYNVSAKFQSIDTQS